MPRVLVIDDDAGQVDVRRLILEHGGHSVAAATTPAAARDFELVRLDEVSNLVRLGRMVEARCLLEGHEKMVLMGVVGSRYELALRLNIALIQVMLCVFVFVCCLFVISV